ncbi:Hypothetical predicted protein [Pelobates cultripes]|uniref:Uncharacterized protein n=1 Tax=Pelobates cultripes TaxID=61616 RepID=A0AAD1VZ07_PELCU|nr:Hypothetical predicted protein [Pelobates cultripes]
MDKHSKKLKTLSGESNRSIGELFTTRPKSKMAAPPDISCSSSSSEDLMDALTLYRRQQGQHLKCRLRTVVHRAFFHADLVVIQEEVSAVTDRAKVREEDISTLLQCQADSTEQIQRLQTSHTAMQDRLVTVDNARRHNLKVRGIAESVVNGELPHFAYSLPYCPSGAQNMLSLMVFINSLNPQGHQLQLPEMFFSTF